MADEQKQEPNRGAGSGSLAENLNRIARESSGLGVLFGEAVARRLGIAHADLECLDMIFVRGRVTAGEIAAASGLTTGAVTGLLDRLERAKLVRRERDAGDRRKVYVTVLPAALKAARTYYGSFENEMKLLIESYTEDQLALLIDFFSRSRKIILREIQKVEEPKGPLRKNREPAASRR
jgi:DNA-binding MarR family transcriptional regulator